MTDLAALARANADAADSRRPRERIEDRIELSAVERQAVELIRRGVFPKELRDRFVQRRTRGPVLNQWEMVCLAVLHNVPLWIISGWYLMAPDEIEARIREVLAAWADWREAGIAGAAS